jgi:hypothetical protein
MPITGRTNSPSGLALTQVIAQLYVTVFARMISKQRDSAMKKLNEKEAITAAVEKTVICSVGSKGPAAGKHSSYTFLGAQDKAKCKKQG